MDNAVGYVVGEVETHRFSFITSTEKTPPRLEYLVIPGVEERIDDRKIRVDVLAQVTRLQVASQMLDAAHTYDETQTLLSGDYMPQPKVLGTANVLGYLYQDSQGRSIVRVPRSTPLPGQPVFRAPDDLLNRFFTNDVDLGIEAGTLINRPNVSVKLSPNGLRRHLAIIAQTGAGKSYLSGLVLENLLQLGGTVIVFDPNSDYVRLRLKAGGMSERTPFAHRVEVFRVPGVEGRRYPDEEIGGARPYTVKFSELEPDEVCGLAGIGEHATNIRHAIKTACENLVADGRDYRPDDLKRHLQRMAGLDEDRPPLPDIEIAQASPDEFDTDEDVFGEPSTLYEAIPAKAGRAPRTGSSKVPESMREGAEKAIKYIDDLCAYKIWGFTDVPMDDLLEPMRLSVVDLAGMEQYVAQYAVQKTLSEIWRRATTGKLNHPVFVVMEEAHNFVPGARQGGSSECARWINRIASEGRKFKVFLVVITQRPGKIDPDTLSQCGSQIVMKLTNPEDQKAVRNASESLSESLFTDLPGLNTGEAIVLGPLTRVPVLIRVSGRVSAEGGSDVDVIAALQTARGTVRTRELERQGAFQPTQRTELKEDF